MSQTLLGFSLQVKIFGLVVGSLVLLGTWVSFHTRTTLQVSLTQQLDDRAISISRDLSARSTDLILTNNAFTLHQLARDTLENNKDVRYVFILDSWGRILAHTFGDHFPEGLLEANSAAPQQRYHLEVISTEEGLIHDVAVPVFEGKAGMVRVGLSEKGIQQVLNDATRDGILATAFFALLGTLAGFLLTRILTRPLQELVEVARAVGSGDWRRKARIYAPDETGLLAEAINEMTDKLAHAQEVRSQLLKKVISAQEEERQRLARELHDETSQSLTALILGLKALGDSTPGEQVKARTGELRDQVSRTLEEVRHLALELRPSTLDDAGLAAAIRRYILDYSHKCHLDVDLHITGLEEKRLDWEIETALYRIIQEALTNVARHSGGQNVSVVLEGREDSITAIVEDDGQGFNVEETLSAAPRQQLGLFGMKERAALIGGTLTLESSPGKGTTVFVKIPL
ncbi:MAG: histidine kinase [Firmicutes bacterium]|nr:histidine kinase [Bacillota bacterium]